MRTSTRTPHAARAIRTHRVAARRVTRRLPAQALVRRAPQVTVGRAGARLTRRGRVVLLLALVGLLFAAFSYGRSGVSVGAATEKAPAAPVVQTTVQPGESLWTVAVRIAPESDPRDVMQQIRRLNDLQSVELQAGQQLLLPA